ncbi:VCBS repeat-containing protein [Bradyrhizobium sp. Ghvi]|uniref:LuxR C-terminal-related transcriptional regulator n=1 Tax=Bradyrhizobium sp. Ghvi TaxID=1855319 RepID=UPI0008F189D4|nr:LuxR C-terminal-related transcriptional regulator [Bradyrhizobium sp. Ghvi]SFO28700.1 VCBS repeat-containing protein [Bradyrhizobium sp. Ghvi]
MLVTKARMRPIRLVIADRRPIVLQGFASLFAAERDFAIVASCSDGADCLKAIRKLAPDLVLVEDGFSDVTAAEMLALVKAENIPTRLVFYTASLAQGDLAAAIAAGACCAISMREEPKALLQSLRLVAPIPERATAGREENGVLGETGLAALTDQERKIMRLVACGMSNKQIARQLKVSTGTIKARLNQLSTQLEIKSRTEVAAFALSRLYGGIGALAALIYAVLNDLKAANASAFGEASTDTVPVVTADGSTEVITIKIDNKKATPASGKTAKSALKAGRGETPITETPVRAGKLVQSSTDIAPPTIASQATNAARAVLGSYGPFVMTAVGIWICELLNSVAHAANFADAVFAPASGGSAGESAALGLSGNADANLGSLDNLAWLRPDIDQSFAFEAPRSDGIAGHGDASQIIGADAGEVSASSIAAAHVGSGAADAPIDHDGFAQTAATDVSGNGEHDRTQATGGDESKPGQPQRGLHDGEDGGPASKQHDEQGSPESSPSHGQSQRDAQESKDETGLAKGHSKYASSGDEFNDAQSQRDLHKSDHDPAAAGHDARDDASPAEGGKSGQSERDLHENAQGNPHAGLSAHAGANEKASDDAGPAQKGATPQPEDSFHFRNEIAPSGTSTIAEMHGGHGQDFIGYGLHTAAHDGPPPVPAFDLIGPSDAEQSVLNHATGAAHHLTHDLLV